MPEIRAPGKLVLGGEYAVVYGGVALAVPVVSGSATWQQGEGVRLEPFGLEASSDGEKLRWQKPSDVTARFDRLWQHCLQYFAVDVAAQQLVVDTSAFLAADGRKWGFGSSGVSLWLTVAALAELAGRADDAWACLQAFRAAEAEQGSGIDLAVARTGAAVLHTLPETLRARVRDIEVFAVQLPDSQSTEGTLQALPEAGFPKVLLDQARLLATCWEASAWDVWLAQLRAYDAALDIWLGQYRLARLPAVQDLQQQLGDAWYVRPCGAGGDSALLLPVDPARVSELNLENEVIPVRI